MCAGELQVDGVQPWFTTTVDVPPGTELLCEWWCDNDQKEGCEGSLHARVHGTTEWVCLTAKAAPLKRNQLALSLPASVLGGKLELGYQVSGGDHAALRVQRARLELRRSSLKERVIAAQQAGAVAVIVMSNDETTKKPSSVVGLEEDKYHPAMIEIPVLVVPHHDGEQARQRGEGTRVVYQPEIVRCYTLPRFLSGDQTDLARMRAEAKVHGALDAPLVVAKPFGWHDAEQFENHAELDGSVVLIGEPMLFENAGHIDDIHSELIGDGVQPWFVASADVPKGTWLVCVWRCEGVSAGQTASLHARAHGTAEWVCVTSETRAPHEQEERLALALPDSVLCGKLELGYRISGEGGSGDALTKRSPTYFENMLENMSASSRDLFYNSYTTKSGCGAPPSADQSESSPRAPGAGDDDHGADVFAGQSSFGDSFCGPPVIDATEIAVHIVRSSSSSGASFAETDAEGGDGDGGAHGASCESSAACEVQGQSPGSQSSVKCLEPEETDPSADDRKRGRYPSLPSEAAVGDSGSPASPSPVAGSRALSDSVKEQKTFRLPANHPLHEMSLAKARGALALLRDVVATHISPLTTIARRFPSSRARVRPRVRARIALRRVAGPVFAREDLSSPRASPLEIQSSPRITTRNPREPSVCRASSASRALATALRRTRARRGGQGRVRLGGPRRAHARAAAAQVRAHLAVDGRELQGHDPHVRGRVLPHGAHERRTAEIGER